MDNKNNTNIIERFLADSIKYQTLSIVSLLIEYEKHRDFLFDSGKKIDISMDFYSNCDELPRFLVILLNEFELSKKRIGELSPEIMNSIIVLTKLKEQMSWYSTGGFNEIGELED